MGKFLEQIRLSDDATKKRWTIIGTAVAMLVVLVLWFGYFGTLVRPAPLLQPEAGSNDNRSFIGVMRDGFKALASGFRDTIAGGINRLKEPKSYIIKPE